jgi:GNAT superfamily N-acetyltransferase
MKPQTINRLIAGDKSYRNGVALYKGETQLSFEVVSDSAQAEQVVDAMEDLTDYSDPCPFHEWVQYGLDESAGLMVTVNDGSRPCGFVIFDVRLEIDSSTGIDKIDLFVELERLYVAGTQRNKGFGKALVAAVASAAQSALLPISSATGKVPNIRYLTLYLSGDTLSPAGDRLMRLLLGAIEKQAFSLIHSAKIAEFRIQDMTGSLHESADD